MILQVLREKGIFDRRKKPRPTPAEELEKAVSELSEVTKQLTAQLNHDPDWLRRTLLEAKNTEAKKDKTDGCDCDTVCNNHT